MKKRSLSGLFLIVVGVVISINSLSMTGYVVGEGVKEPGFLIGLIFVVGGIVIYLAKRRITASDLVSRTQQGTSVIISDRFLRSARGHNIASINDAIEKIGTGLGREEALKLNRNLRSIRATDRNRLIFYRRGQNVVLDDYVLAHDYGKYFKERA